MLIRNYKLVVPVIGIGIGRKTKSYNMQTARALQVSPRIERTVGYDSIEFTRTCPAISDIHTCLCIENACKVFDFFQTLTQ